MVSPPDLTTLYPTLAAVSSGIVGLLGAVLGSRLIDHIPRLREHRMIVNRQIQGVVNDFDIFKRNLGMYLQALREERTRLAAVVDRHQTSVRVEREFSPWEIRTLNQSYDVDPVNRASVVESKYNQGQRLDQAFPTLTGTLRDEDILRWIAQLEGERNRHEEPQAKELLRNRIVDLRSLLNYDIAPFRAEVLPPSFWTIFGILALFVVFGIAAPLLIVSGPALFSPPFLFLAVVFGLFLLIGYFLSQIFLVIRIGRLEWR